MFDIGVGAARRRAHAGWLLVGVLCMALAAGRMPAQAATIQATLEVVADGLANPRGMDFDRDGTLYVTEAGRGGDTCIGEGDQQVCVGYTGAVTRVAGGTKTQVVKNLASSVRVSTSEVVGPVDVSVLPNGNAYVIVGLGADPAIREELGEAGADLGHLVRANLIGGTWQNFVDVAAYETTANPDGGEIDSNPYALVALRDRWLVADAGGNALLNVAYDGAIETLAVFPDRKVPAPPPLPPVQISMQSVPDTVVVGPDGAYYIGELTGFPFPVGEARVQRLVPGSEPTEYATGLTNIIDMAFDSAGNLYVLEIAKNGLFQAGQTGDYTGALIRIAPDGTKTEIISDGLVSPAGIAISPTGGVFVSNNGTSAEAGQVVRVVLCDAGTPGCVEPRGLSVPLVSDLSGDNEVSNAGVPGAGDPDGSGTALVTLDVSAGRACIQATVENILTPTAAHIHQGAAGTNGIVVVNFSSLINGNVISGCVSADTAVLANIEANPEGFYVNVHNAEYPNGAVRGQLQRGNTVETRSFSFFLPVIIGAEE